MRGKLRREKSWNERAQRIYFYLHLELANKTMTIVRWAYPSLLENTFKNRLKRHDMISKLIPIIKHLKGKDVIHNVENDEPWVGPSHNSHFFVCKFWMKVKLYSWSALVPRLFAA